MIEDPISNVVLISCFKKFPTTCFLFFIQCKKDARVQKCEKQNRDKAYRILNYSTLKSGTAHRCFLLITHAAWCWILLITHDEYFIHILYFLCTDIRAYINFIWSSLWNRFLTTENSLLWFQQYVNSWEFSTFKICLMTLVLDMFHHTGCFLLQTWLMSWCRRNSRAKPFLSNARTMKSVIIYGILASHNALLSSSEFQINRIPINLKTTARFINGIFSFFNQSAIKLFPRRCLMLHSRYCIL